jgi:hypothetical protein
LASHDQYLGHLTDRAFTHIQNLSADIGPRGSCTSGELDASNYVVSAFQETELQEVQTQEFKGSPSSYARYGVALGAALISQIVAGLWQIQGLYIAAAGIHVLSAIAMYAESDFRRNWTHWFVRSQPSHNVLACRPAQKTAERTVVITAHLDTHRTPFFNSNLTWQRLYNLSFRLLFLSLISGAVFAGILGYSELLILKILFHAQGVLLALGILAFLHADRTPYSPGAYDNASGVACMLSIAEDLKNNPLENTTAWLIATGCEETGAGGMQALVKAKSDSWRDALWINLDQTGIGGLYIRLREGMLRRYAVQPAALHIAREAASISRIELRERASQAFSDAIIAFQNGLQTISLGASPTEPGHETPRHQSSDVPERIQQETLHQTIRYVIGLLSIWDQQEQG